MLSNATTISIEEAPKLVESFGGICYPAHIDRDANGIISVLGTFPKTPNFTCAELHDAEKRDEYATKYDLSDKRLVISSDAHYLWDIKERSDFILLEEITNKAKAGESIIKLLRKGL